MTRWWHPSRHALRRERLMQRATISLALRHWFAAEGFTEVETAAIQRSPGSEPHLHPFVIDWQAIDGSSRERFLHSSPEFAMKKLLVAGEKKIFQLAKVWRNREESHLHAAEFTMLEWYRVVSSAQEAATRGLAIAIDDCHNLIKLASQSVSQTAPFRFNGMECDATAPIEWLSVAEAFEKFASIDILATAPNPRAPDFALLRQAAAQAGIDAHDGDDWESLFFRIMFDKIEPQLGRGCLTALTHYPQSMAALARLDLADPRTALRFEIYAAGVELANGFVELTDSVEQKQRFIADQSLKQRLFGQTIPLEEDFLAALDYGLPPTVGVALGFDRLVMLASGAKTIHEIIWSPVE